MADAYIGYHHNANGEIKIGAANNINFQTNSRLMMAFNGNFMTEEQIRHNDAIVCYDLFLIMDETNLRFLTWQ